jgi:hypothetical protein
MKKISKKAVFSLLVFLLVVFTPQAKVEAAQNQFIVGVWVEASPTILGYNQSNATSVFTTLFQKISADGFNTVRPSNLPHHWRPVVESFMTLAAQHGLKVILDPGEGHNLMTFSSTSLQANRASWKNYLKTNVTDRFSGYSSLIGYAVIDEPSLYQCKDQNGNPVSVSLTEKLARWNFIVELLNELDPVHPDYTVFRDPSALAMAVNSYPRKAVAFDNYPFEQGVPNYQMGPDPNGTKAEYNWYVRYKGYSEAAQPQYNDPQLSVIQAFSQGECPWRYPKPEELRTTVYSSLAAGAKGVMFFIYKDTPFGGIYDLYGLLSLNYVANNLALYNEAKTLAAELTNLGPTIMTLSSTTNGLISGWATTAQVLKSSYQNSAGVKFHIVANKNPDPASGTVNYQLQLPGSGYYVTDIVSGQTYTANSTGKATIPLAPAKGRVLSQGVPQSITVTSPTSGTTWVKGTSNQVRWTSVGISGNVSIILHKKNSSTTYTIDASHPYNGSPKNYTVPTSVPAGTYYVKVSKGSITGSSSYFSITDPGAPKICLDKSSVSMTGNRGNTLTKTFRVKNCGTGTLNYTISDNRGWLTVSTTSGSSTGEYDTITITANTGSLSYGTNYTGTVTVSASGTASKTVAVNLRVRHRKYTLYRYLHHADGDHYYSTTSNDSYALSKGYVYEGPACTVYKQQEPGTVAFHQYYNSAIGNHFYSANYNELGAGKYGYVYQKVACYVYTSSAETGSKVLYRYYNDTIGDHYYTVNYSELGSGKWGFVYEGPACVVF